MSYLNKTSYEINSLKFPTSYLLKCFIDLYTLEKLSEQIYNAKPAALFAIPLQPENKKTHFWFLRRIIHFNRCISILF